MSRKKTDGLEPAVTAAPESETETPNKDAGAELSLENGQQDDHRYKITCCNPVNKQIGGIVFRDGVAYTDDAYAASWFRNKKGYVVTMKK